MSPAEGWPAALHNPFEKGKTAWVVSKILSPDGRDRERILLLARPQSDGTQAHAQDTMRPVRYLPCNHPKPRLEERPPVTSAGLLAVRARLAQHPNLR